METIFITGTNGLLGQKMVSQVTQTLAPILNYQVIAIAKSENKVQLPQNTKFVQLDLTNYQKTKELFQVYQPKIIIHTAALTLPDVCEKDKTTAYLQNVGVVENLVELCKITDTFLVHLSTDFVFDGRKGLYHEKDEPSPVNYYGFTKLVAEKKVLESGIAASIVRTCLVYGQNAYMSRGNIVTWVKSNLEQKKAIKVVADQFRTPTLVDDLARACWQIALQKASGIWHISGNEYLSPFEMAQKIASFYGLNSQLISPTNEKEFIEIAKRPLKTGFDISKAQNILGFQPISFLEGLSKM